ncbi:hypothetical protein BCV70DRAFT_236186 [Testicularia cyperi]|uniref:P-loop containing nucleoside triphosphate hydrolase protein n=1 Tax=Testicularia cyperi TaxID=1882483 RepID=A0A317XT26_9BASI|nr:hypothetical protein BCV70DRAFT_236186 [Testicularia cyperi]
MTERGQEHEALALILEHLVNNGPANETGDGIRTDTASHSAVTPGVLSKAEHKHWWKRFFPDQLESRLDRLFADHHLGNYVAIRGQPGQRIFESMPIYVRVGMHLLFYKSKEQSFLRYKTVEELLQAQSIRQGKVYDDESDPQAVLEHILSFIKTYAINLQELLEPDPSKYPSFNSFFFRRLRPGVRPIAEPENPAVISSCADCRLTVYHDVEESTKYWIKGEGFSINRLIGDTNLADRSFPPGSSLAIFRLAPADYHRYHHPVGPVINGPTRHISGEYYTVNPQAVNADFDVFSGNRRDVLLLNWRTRPDAAAPMYPVAFVAIGAMLVGSIGWTNANQSASASRGDELGYFAYGGSTVVCVFPPEAKVQFDADLVENSRAGIETMVRELACVAGPSRLNRVPLGVQHREAHSGSQSGFDIPAGLPSKTPTNTPSAPIARSKTLAGNVGTFARAAKPHPSPRGKGRAASALSASSIRAPFFIEEPDPYVSHYWRDKYGHPVPAPTKTVGDKDVAGPLLKDRPFYDDNPVLNGHHHFGVLKSGDLYRDAYIAEPDRFDWRKRSPQVGPRSAALARATAAKQQLPMQRRRPSQAMLKGEESKVATKMRRKKEKRMDDRGQRMMKEEEIEALLRYAEREPIRQESIRYRFQWSEMLDYERAQELETIKERRKAPIQQLIEEGIAIDGLQAYWQDESRRHFGKRVAVFKLSAAQSLPRNLFRAGDKVTIMPSRPSTFGDVAFGNPSSESESVDLSHGKDGRLVEAEVVEKQKSYLRLKFDEEDEDLDLVSCPSWRLDYGFNDLTFERIKSALQALDHDVEHIETKYGAKFQYILSGTRLSDIILGVEAPADRVTRGAFWEDARVQSWYDRFSRRDPIIIEGDPVPDLNESQTRAVAMMLRERISLVQGPPGTGKTRTIVTAIRLLKRDFQVPHPILLAAHTNVAVDNLAEGCIKDGLKVVRIGPSARARPSIDKFTLDAYFLRHPAKPRLDDVKRRLDTLEQIKSDLEMKGLGFSAGAARRAEAETHAPAAQTDSVEPAQTWEDVLASEADDRSNEFSADRDEVAAEAAEEAASAAEEYESVKKQLSKLKGHYFFLRSSIRGDILRNADVICGSAIAAGSPELDMIDLPVVFFDEASMATEPVSLVPLMKGCRHLAIIGDHKQLPPVVTSLEAKQGGLSRSLFERLINRGDPRIKSTMLDVQFRMHPSLAEFPNQTFYDGALRNGHGTDKIPVVQSRYLNLATSRTHEGESAPEGQITSNDDVTRRHLAFVNHKGRESKADNHSLRNLDEAQAVFDIIVDLLERNPDLKGSDIGVVTPYVGQQIHFEKMLQNELSNERKRAAALPSLGATRSAELGHIDVHTVDGFEGREKKVIIFSTVRTNAQGYVGFLADGRRLNVALTRAKSALFVVGNIETFRNAQLSEAARARVDSPNLEALRSYAEFVEQKRVIVELESCRQPASEEDDVDVEGEGDRGPELGESDSLHWQHVKDEQNAL